MGIETEFQPFEMRVIGAAAVAGVLGISAVTSAAVDQLTTVLTPVQTVGGVTNPSPLGAYGYDASTGDYYAVGFNSLGQDIRKISGGTVTRLITNSPYLTFGKGGNADNGGGTPTPGSLRLNPKPILNPDGTVAIPAYGTAVIADGAGVVTTGTGAGRVNQLALSRRVYRVDLFKFANGTVPPNTTASNQALVPLVSTADLFAASGYAGTSTSTNTSRQVAYSGDGQSVYFVDTSANSGGLYRASVRTGALTKITPDASENTEPAVITVAGVGGAADVDHIYQRGGGSTLNDNGIDSLNATTGVRSVAVTAATLQGFLENGVNDLNIVSMATDADNNLYFGNTNSTPGAGGGIFRLDPQNRLIKVVSYSERKAYNADAPLNAASFNAGQLRMQADGRTVPFAGVNGGFDVPLLTYAESSPVSAVNGVLLFKPVDLNRDNAVDSLDTQLLGGKLTVRGVKQTDADHFKFDLNGNDVVDFADVKIAQQFVDFSSADVNLNLTVDFADLDLMRDNYLGEGKVWITGDLTGDDLANYSDLLTLASAWLSILPGPAEGELESRYAGQFLTDARTAFAVVPEPAALATLALAGGLLVRRRRNG